MDKNYYQILTLRRNATPSQISQSYRKLVLRWHPKFAKEDQKTSLHNFSQISEAYEVLSDPIKRSFYDKYGWKKLKEGLFIDGQLKGGYRFANNPDQIFQKFFKDNNVMAKILDQKIIQKGSIFSHAFGALNYKDTYPNSDLVVEVPCTLSELYCGVAKKSSYNRKVLNLDGRTLSTVKQQKLLEIKPGFGSTSTLLYPHQGHQNISRNKSNLIFKIKEIGHPSYTRQDNNLIYLANIRLPDAIACTPIQIRTLDDRILRVSLDQVPKYLYFNDSPQVLKEIVGEGMPVAGDGKGKGKGAKGNLYIRFSIEFPRVLSEQVKNQLRSLLPEQ